MAPGSMIPLFGRTQYRRGAVVFTLKHTFLSEGFLSLRFVVTTSVKGPAKKKEKKMMVVYCNQYVHDDFTTHFGSKYAVLIPNIHN